MQLPCHQFAVPQHFVLQTSSIQYSYVVAATQSDDCASTFAMLSGSCRGCESLVSACSAGTRQKHVLHRVLLKHSPRPLIRQKQELESIHNTPGSVSETCNRSKALSKTEARTSAELVLHPSTECTNINGGICYASVDCNGVMTCKA